MSDLHLAWQPPALIGLFFHQFSPIMNCQLSIPARSVLLRVDNDAIQKRSLRGALRPALPSAGLIAYPVAGGVLEAGVSHVFISRL